MKPTINIPITTNNKFSYFYILKWITNLFTKRKSIDNTNPDPSNSETNSSVHLKKSDQEHETKNITAVSKKFLIVGLGNIGVEYVNTRHNVGFKILDYLASAESVPFESVKLGSVAQYKFKGRTFFLLKPNTYMNLSGKAVQYWMEKEKIPLENVLVITDDLNLEFGTIRIRMKGSDGGHNGLKNINTVLNTQNYARFRFGISDQFKKGQQVHYVLGEWNDAEKKALPERLALAAEIIRSFGTAGIENTMSNFNGK